MLKEIHDQPRALADTFRGRISLKNGDVSLEGIKLTQSQVKAIKRIHLVACGTAWHACLVGKFMLEEIAGIPAEVDYGSEFRYRSPLMDPQSILLMVSQSGETADTLAATEIARAKKAKILAICNVVDSSIARKAHGVSTPMLDRKSALPVPKRFQRSLPRCICSRWHWGGLTAS